MNMNYFEMMEINLLEITSFEDAEEKAKNVANSDIDEVLKYINYLRYTYNNSDDFDLMDKITKFLFIDEIATIEREHSEIAFGDTLDLKLVKKEEVVKPENALSINDEDYNCVSQLSDNYETILILKNSEDKYYKYGCIDDEDNIGRKYVYELEVEADDFYETIVDAKIGTKVNIISAITSEQSFRKTFIKETIDIGYSFITVMKTSKGVFSNVISGTMVILKDPEIILKDPEPIKVVKETPKISMSGNGGISVMTGDDFMDLMNNAGGSKGLEEKMKSDMFADMLGDTVAGGLDDDMKEMVSDSVRLSDDEFKEKWGEKLEEMKNNSNVDGVDDMTDEELDENDNTKTLYDISDLENQLRIAIKNEEFEKASEIKEMIKEKSFETTEQILYSCDKPTDIIISGTQVNETSDFSITDDYSSFSITKNNKSIEDYVECDGFVSITSAKYFIENIHSIESLEGNFDEDCGSDFYLIKGFVGDLKLKIKVNDIFIDPNITQEYILHDCNDIYGDGTIIDINVEIGNAKIQKITNKIYKEIKKRNNRIDKLNVIIEDKEIIDTKKYTLDKDSISEEDIENAIEDEMLEEDETIDDLSIEVVYIHLESMNGGEYFSVDDILNSKNDEINNLKLMYSQFSSNDTDVDAIFCIGANAEFEVNILDENNEKVNPNDFLEMLLK